MCSYDEVQVTYSGGNLTEVMLCSSHCILLSTILVCLTCGDPSNRSRNSLEGLTGLSVYSEAHSQDSVQGRMAKHLSIVESQGSFQEFSAVESHKTH